MSKKCETVIISDKAYNAMIRESFAKHPVETGGILLGYILDNGLWIVMEMIPPGINGVFETAYFEYDQDFVNYLGTSVANQYKEPLQVLGLWHRHPGSMDYFSSTDDGTNSEFASKNPYGVISGLVNIDPSFRLTMYHLDHNNGMRPRNIAYTTVDVEIGDDLIPEKFFALRYIDEERSDLHPTPTHKNTQISHTHSVPRSPRNVVNDCADIETEEKNTVKTKVLKKHNPQKRRNLIFTIAFAVLVLSAGLIIGIKAISPAPNYEDVNTNQLPDNKNEADIKGSLLSAITNTTNIKYYPYTGTLTEGDSIYKIALSFVLADSIINKAIYTNLKYGGKIAMKVEQLNDSMVKLNGRDGSNDFFIELKSYDPKKLTGKASIGKKEFNVSLSHNISANQLSENSPSNGNN